MKYLHIALYVLSIVDVTVTWSILCYIQPPFTAISILLVLLVDVLVRAFLKQHIVTIYQANETRGEGSLQKAIVLQIWLYLTRLWRYAVAFLPACCLWMLSEQPYAFADTSWNLQVMTIILRAFSYIFLIIGVAMVECVMFRYMAVWYLLPCCKSVKQAINSAKTLASYQFTEVCELCLRSRTFSHARADWVARQLQSTKHAYNFNKNTQTTYRRKGE